MTEAPFRWCVGFALIAVAAFGLLVSVQPFTGDQALFASGARQLARGNVLYRDFWDVKQPGIYAFYLAGGALVGYREVALHLFELATLLAFGWFLAATLRTRFDHQWIGAVVPLLVVGTYYATAEPVQLGQVESLIGIPLFVTLWCSVRAGGADGRGRWLLGAGIAAGITLGFKLVFIPIVVAFVFLALLAHFRSHRGDRGRRLAADGAWWLTGLALPIGVVVAYLAAHGQLETVRWTYLDITPTMTDIAGRPLGRLVEGGTKTAARWAVPLALAAYGAFATFRRGWDRLETGLAAWIVLGIPIFALQHWWIYQYAMFLVPIGIFAAHGLDALGNRWRELGRRRIAVAFVALVLAVPIGLRIARNTRDVVTHGFAISAEDRSRLRADVEPQYRAAHAWARHLRRAGPTPRGVYVLGNPLDLYLADRSQTVAINGWSPEQYNNAVWARLRGQIDHARPTEIVVDTFSDHIMADRSPETRRLIQRLYRRVGGFGADTWYRLRTAAPAAPSYPSRAPTG